MFIIDFDDTLFDTHALKLARRDALHELGVEEELFWRTYSEARNGAAGIFTYTNERHADVLAQHGVERESALQALIKTTSREQLSTFLFSDTISGLEALRAFHEPMILLSLGDKKFQELKVTGTGVGEFFDQMYMVHDTKAHVIGEILKEHPEEKIWFINDKIDETKMLSEKFPRLKPVVRPSRSVSTAACASCGFPCFSTLTDIVSYVEFTKIHN